MIELKFLLDVLVEEEKQFLKCRLQYAIIINHIVFILTSDFYYITEATI